MKRQSLIWLILICVPLVLLSYDLLWKIDSKKEKREREKQQRSDYIKSQILSRHDTLELPPDMLYKKKYYIYTHGLQTSLIHENKEAILFKGLLKDITKEGNNFIVHFKPDDKGLRQGLSFHLKCKDEYVNSILEHHSEEREKHDREEYWVVCRVTEVNKISIDSADLYSIKGEVIEMVKI